MQFSVHAMTLEYGKKVPSGRKYGDPATQYYAVCNGMKPSGLAVMSVEKETMEKYFKFLDDLRLSGKTNMFGAAPYLTAAFPADTMLASGDIAGAIVIYWMATFSIRHPRK